MNEERVRIRDITTLSHDWYLLQKTTFDYLRGDGQWQTQTRETYDRGDGATILLYNRAKRTVILVRQFRFPTYREGHDGFLIEAAAGLLEQASPEQRIRAEVEEETGYRVGQVHKVFDAFMSPGSVTERLHFFAAEYEASSRLNGGGGLAQEGEDIEVLELPLDVALRMVADGRICDGKTIMLLQHAQLHLMPAQKSLQILVAGPYRSGTGDDPVKMAANVAAMEAQCLPLYAAGHMPVLGEWLALPMLALAGSRQVGDAVYEQLFHTHCERLLAHCDGVLRIGGDSSGADRMVAVARGLGLPIWFSLEEIPTA
ncbi:ADP-ribose pyrophosphatase [Janthinobacterium psychrotolerans]|uniref:GDP-mannose pyrophosphatase n=1 Tax=Janthinobacterium psychrotolerans TaxID=1747903 RepID=A0A1A7C5N3_9BURK|nr:ADP-ribose pyrophosphatase [Janthinobacterium psychrotolerans]